ncbi:MAG TPA: MAPEG family protein [Spongiibacteraceae bacterium]|nr:MAPEG family protein [Spongiibacteraceae bacterium]
MKIPFICLAIVLLIPYLLAAYGGHYRKQQFGKMDNQNPRAQAAQLDSYGARIYAAQQNSWEAATLFGASVLAAMVAGVAINSVAIPSLLFLAFRILHAVAYLRGWSKLRSSVSTAGITCCTWLIVNAIIAVH